MNYIVEFPAGWFLRKAGNIAVATGDIQRATRFDSIEDAKAAIKLGHFKRAAKAAAKFIAVVA